MPLGTTMVAGSVGVVFPCMLIVLVVVGIVVSILIGVHTLILVLSVVCILASVWNVAVLATGNRGFQWWALVCYLHEPSVYLLICFGYDVFKGNSVPVTLAIGHQVCFIKEFVLPSCPVLTTSKGFAVGPGIVKAGDVGLGCFPQSR